MSSSSIAIHVDHLSKMYKVYERRRDIFRELVTSQNQHKEFWALRDISFDVGHGEVVGVIGRNGAGKSTLLKILTGTLDKTSGSLEVNGRISAILELGTGFSGEYTGRENVFLGGLMVGMSREEINQKMDWIIQFSELGSVIDQPFRTYSTGMRARLTFSTAVCIDPEILIVDEALSVGDARFQSKCFAKIDEFRQAGNTILLVSHDLNTISSFCDRAILLERGQLVEQGEPKEITKLYYRLVFTGDQGSGRSGHSADPAEPEAEMSENGNTSPPRATGEASAEGEPILAPNEAGKAAIRRVALMKLNLKQAVEPESTCELRIGNGKAEILDFGILDETGRRAKLLVSGRKYTFYARAVFYEDVGALNCGFLIRDGRGVDMFGMHTGLLRMKVQRPKEGDIVESRLDATMWLTNGFYLLSASMSDPENGTQYDYRCDGYQFEVARKFGLHDASVVDLDAELTVQKVFDAGAADFEVPPVGTPVQQGS